MHNKTDKKHSGASRYANAQSRVSSASGEKKNVNASRTADSASLDKSSADLSPSPRHTGEALHNAENKPQPRSINAAQQTSRRISASELEQEHFSDAPVRQTRRRNTGIDISSRDEEETPISDNGKDGIFIENAPVRRPANVRSQTKPQRAVNDNDTVGISVSGRNASDGETYNEDICIQNVRRSREEVEQARQRNEQRQAMELERTIVSRGAQDNTGSIFINESEVTQEVGKNVKGSRSKKGGSFVSTLPELFRGRTKPRSYFLSILFTTLRLLLVCVLVIGISGLGAVLGLAKAYVDSIPTLDFSVFTETPLVSVIYDINGEVLTNYYGSENREWAKLDDIPDNLKNAVIAVEDVRFYRHIGIDFKRLIGSFILNATGDSVQGGSTITQQLIKNQLLSPEQTYKRKIREAYLAIKLEETYSKDQILEFYLNTIPMGGLIYGVKTAAKDYFNKELSELTLLECATLAGITNNPTRYNPRLNYYKRNNPEQSDKRTRTVLDAMLKYGYISQQEYDEALSQKLEVCENSTISTNYEMLSFVEYSIYDAITQLLKVNNLEDTSENRSKMDKLIRENGYSIYTTIDPKQQKAAENAVYNYSNYPSMADINDKYSYDGQNPDGSYRTLIQPQAASVVIDYRTGYIVAMVNGRQPVTGLKTFNRAYQSTMPVGSSIKPLAVYGPAIEGGLAPGSVMYDTRSPIRNWDTDYGYPRNYNDKGYVGEMTLRTAITKSTNTVAAQLLMYYVGGETAANTLVNLGIDPSHIEHDGPGLALGTSGITPLEMAGAYSALANMGQYIQPISFTKIVDKDGNTVLNMLDRQERRQVFKPSTSYMMIDMLQYALKTNRSKALISGQTVGGKTGTVMKSRGIAFSGFSGYYACSVWIGSDKFKSLSSSTTGASHAAGLWHDIMEPLHEGLPDRPIADTDAASLGITRVKFCKYSGQLANESCPETIEDIGLYSDLVTDRCTCHQYVTVCSETGCLATEACPSTKQITLLSLPLKGQLPFMYKNYHEIYAQYWPDPDEPLVECGKHAGTWDDEVARKYEWKHKSAALINKANERIKDGGLSQEALDTLNAHISELKNICADLSSVTSAQIITAYNALGNYLKSLDPNNQ